MIKLIDKNVHTNTETSPLSTVRGSVGVSCGGKALKVRVPVVSFADKKQEKHVHHHGVMRDGIFVDHLLQ
jgi:hypothetical protein